MQCLQTFLKTKFDIVLEPNMYCRPKNECKHYYKASITVWHELKDMTATTLAILCVMDSSFSISKQSFLTDREGKIQENCQANR